ncbi:MAG: SGNH/GDSL hydrolase family protein [Muribaculaceae bacterium]|jgi:hypothetical protein|nr:SGNH/GDSL hydrolase family protein [Muribaculaceae bacterium]
MNISKIVKTSLLTSLLALFGVSAASAFTAEQVPMKYVNVLNLRMINKCFDNSLTPFTRIPAYLKDSVRPDLWERSQCSSGMAVRFVTNSKRIGIRYNLRWNSHMPHMADTGIKGTDLYRLDDNGVWQFVNANRPRKDSIQQFTYVENLKGDMRDFVVYLPLYDGVNWMEIGVDSNAVIQKPQLDNPRKDKKIIFYGTSILQGGCSTRTGMVATNMIQRDLNCECVNIGISGEGKMDYCMARAMASVRGVSAYVIDPVPNCTLGMCDTLTYNFVNILRKAHPDIPIVMVEGPLYSYCDFDAFYSDYLRQKNAAFHRGYLKLMQENPNNLYYVKCDNMVGTDNEATVDGTHFTDIGFRRYADLLIPVLKPFVK